MADTTSQSQNTTQPSSAYSGLPRNPGVPSRILENGLVSTTSVAGECFIYQRFSQRLQAYMIDYVNKIYSDYPIYH